VLACPDVEHLPPQFNEIIHEQSRFPFLDTMHVERPPKDHALELFFPNAIDE